MQYDGLRNHKEEVVFVVFLGKWREAVLHAAGTSRGAMRLKVGKAVIPAAPYGKEWNAQLV